jgi:chlorobactene glucosyltransferase
VETPARVGDAAGARAAAAAAGGKLNAFWIEQQAGAAVFLGAILFIALYNSISFRRLGRHRPVGPQPRVSICLPMRNEEEHAAAVLASLLSQDYADFEVLVLDDASSDRTRSIVAELVPLHSRLRLIDGAPLPQGWLGKSWACHQLAAAATGELLLFTDADTRHRPDCLARAVAALQAERADLVSLVPREEVRTLGEALTVPIMLWSITCFLAARMVERWHKPAFTAANGQFLLFRRSAYDQVGGHAAVRSSVAEDLALVRRVARAGLEWRLVDGMRYLSCRMYRTGREAFEGFSKNLFPAFGGRIAVFVFVWLWLVVVYWQPLVVLGLAGAGAPTSSYSLITAGAGVVFGAALWAVTAVRWRYPLYLVPLGPIAILCGAVVAFRSMFLTLVGRARWKDRVLGRDDR